jgi:hypothetical protein
VSTAIQRFAPTRAGDAVTVVPGLTEPRRRTLSASVSGATQATHTLTEVRVSRRTTGPATMLGREATLSGTESSGTNHP